MTLNRARGNSRTGLQDIARVFVVVLLLSAPWGAFAQEGKTPSPTNDLKFRRLYVPADQPEKWPREAAKFPPMLRDEFERRLKSINEQAQGRVRPLARIETARFTARLDGETLVGSAELDIKLDTPSGALLDLHPCDVHVSRPRWKDGAGAAPRLGLAASGRSAAWIERGGTLAFDWTLSRRGTSSSLEYTLALPPALARQLTLDLPREYQPLVPGAVVRTLDTQGEPLAPAAARRFQIELPGRDSIELTLQPVADANRLHALLLARQSQQYEIGPSGTVVAVRFGLEARNHELRQFRVRLEPGLRLMTVRMGNRRLAWSSRTLLDRSGDLVTITMPQPLAQSDGVLVLDALVSTVLGKSWRLPAMRPQDVLWQDESTEIAVAPGLKLLRIDPVKAQLASPLSGGQIRIQHFEPDAAINVRVDWQKAAASLATGTAVVFEPARLAATCRCELRGKTSPRPTLRGELTADWSIDGVQTDPESALEDWNIHRDPQGRTWLTIRLKSTAAGPTPRITVTAQRPIGGTTQWGLDALQPVRWEAGFPENSRHIMSLRAPSPWSLDFSGDEELSVLQITPGSPDRELLGDSPGSLEFLVDSAAQRLRVARRPAASRFRAELHVQADVGPTTLVEESTIRCTPDTDPLDQLAVHWSVSRANAPLWTLNGQPIDARHLRRLTDQEQRQAGFDPRGETWHVVLDPPRSTPFELSATRSTPYASIDPKFDQTPSATEFPASLVMLPEAVAQEGRITVRAVDGQMPRIRTERIAPAAPAESPVDTPRTVRGSFRYEPLRDALPALPPALRIAPLARQADPAALAVRASLTSRIAADGARQHRAVFDVESFGQSGITLTLPPGATDAVVTVAGEGDIPASRGPVADDSSSIAPESVSVRLPPHRRFTTVVVRFTTAGPPLGWINYVPAPWPQIDIPVLARDRHIWLPSEFHVWGSRASSVARRASGHSWVERLFGPFAREAAAAPVGRALTGSHLGAPAALDTRAAQNAAQAWLAALGDEIRKSTTSAGDRSVNCGELFSRVGDGVFIDQAALARRGVSPLTRIPVTTGAENRDHGIALLTRLGLCLCVHRHAMLLTTLEGAAEIGSQLAAVELVDATASPNRLAVVRALPGELTRRLSRAALGDEVSAWRTVAAWSRGPADAAAIWREDDDPSRWDLELRGWTLHAVADSGQSRENTVTFVDASAVESATWALLLATALGTYFLVPKYPRVWFATLTLAAIAALAIPSQYSALAPWFTSLVIGCLMGGAGYLLVRPVGRAKHDVAVRAPAVMAIAALLAIPISTRAPAQQNPPLKTADSDLKPDRAENEIHRVLDPIDADGRPDGKHLYLSEAFFAELIRREADAQSAAHGWLITEAAYHGVFTTSAVAGMTLENPVARFQIVTAGPTQRVRLGLTPPPAKPPGNLPLPTIRLNGVAVPPDQMSWDARDGLIVSISQPGSHRLEAPLTTTTTSADGHRVIDLSIPRVPIARLELTMSPGTAPVTIVGAQSEPRFDAASGKLTASIGGLDRLRLKWPTLADSGNTRPKIQVDPLFWLQVRPGNVTMHARFQVRVSGPPLTHVELDVDPQLVLLPGAKDTSSARLQSSADKSGRLSLELAKPIVESGVVDLEFLLQGVSGVGNLRLPKLQWSAATGSPAWLAVTVDPNLEISAQSGESRAVELADFLRKWAPQPDIPAPRPPTSVYALGADPTQWSLSTRRVQATTTVDQTTTLLFQRGHVLVRYDAVLTAKTGGSFQHVVRVPNSLKGIHIQRVSVLPVEPAAQTQSGIDQVASWSDDTEGSVTAFLSRRSTGRQRLVVEGRLDIAPTGSFALPVFTLEGGDVIRRKFHIDRHSGVNLRVQGTAGLAQLPDEQPTTEDPASASGASTTSTGQPPEPPFAENPTRSSSRRVGTWSALTSATGVVSWQPNEPTVVATLVTSLRPRTDTAWDAQLEARLTVDRGVLDVVRFDVPDAWTDRNTISPPSLFQWENKGSGGRRLAIRPTSPIAGDYRVQIQGQVALGADKRAPIPNFVGPATQNRWLVLPTQWNSQRVIWERRGLREASLPPGFAAPDQAGARFVPFEVLSAASQALWKSYTPAQSEPTVSLADVWIDRRDSRSSIGTVVFDLLPAGRSHCLLQIPSGVRLIQARLGDIPVLPSPLDATTVRIDFGATYLPQSISVLFSASDEGESHRVAVPWIPEWSVQRTLWTAHHAASSRVSWLTPAHFAEPCTALQQWQARVETLSRLRDVAVQQSATDDLRWEPAWRRRLALANAHQNALKRSPSNAPVDSHEYFAIYLSDDAKKDFDNRFDSLALQHQALSLGALGGSMICEVPRTQASAFRAVVRTAWPSASLKLLPAPPSIWGDALTATRLGGGQVTHWIWDQGVSAIDLAPAHPIDNHFWGRWIALGLIGAGVVSVLFAPRRGLMPAVLSPANLQIASHLLLAFAGLFWWLFLWPSWLGLVLLLAAVVSALRFPWQSKAR
jgi:hypothetical protein